MLRLKWSFRLIVALLALLFSALPGLGDEADAIRRAGMVQVLQSEAHYAADALGSSRFDFRVLEAMGRVPRQAPLSGYFGFTAGSSLLSGLVSCASVKQLVAMTSPCGPP